MLLRNLLKKTESNKHLIKKKITFKDSKTFDLLISNATKLINIYLLKKYVNKIGTKFIIDKNNIVDIIRSLFQDVMANIEKDKEYQFIFQDKKLLRQLRQKLIQEATKVIHNYQFDQVVTIPSPVSYNKLDKHIAKTQLTIDKICQ